MLEGQAEFLRHVRMWRDILGRENRGMNPGKWRGLEGTSARPGRRISAVTEEVGMGAPDPTNQLRCLVVFPG